MQKLMQNPFLSWKMQTLAQTMAHKKEVLLWTRSGNLTTGRRLWNPKCFVTLPLHVLLNHDTGRGSSYLVLSPWICWLSLFYCWMLILLRNRREEHISCAADPNLLNKIWTHLQVCFGNREEPIFKSKWSWSFTDLQVQVHGLCFPSNTSSTKTTNCIFLSPKEEIQNKTQNFTS